ncbi:uncharacterized protein C8Q71DRAFT_64249 [Rhodofomes roseus]|uniref:Uncharacterized protein n=1 Tax=Rhodofomes roseus TaxID=34475 RepID=A0ABQ8KF96_9APHY|nr:uncharacterized protein C8Q71DRAFT_64249 [Rhodofomes roseus]KAH9836055.1 hypothetical protein C8Q71DRAFT_64249 [Rhodofomes roseus]
MPSSRAVANLIAQGHHGSTTSPEDFISRDGAASRSPSLPVTCVVPLHGPCPRTLCGRASLRRGDAVSSPTAISVVDSAVDAGASALSPPPGTASSLNRKGRSAMRTPAHTHTHTHIRVHSARPRLLEDVTASRARRAIALPASASRIHMQASTLPVSTDSLLSARNSPQPTRSVQLTRMVLCLPRPPSYYGTPVGRNSTVECTRTFACVPICNLQAILHLDKVAAPSRSRHCSPQRGETRYSNTMHRRYTQGVGTIIVRPSSSVP